MGRKESLLKIHEYQAKQILSRYGIPVPKSEVAFSVEEAKKGAEALGEGVRVVKAQIHAGGRGKGGGVKVPLFYGDSYCLELAWGICRPGWLVCKPRAVFKEAGLGGD